MNPPSDKLSETTIVTQLIDGRDTILARAKFDLLYVDYYLHLMEHDLKNEFTPDFALKQALAALALHSATRPIDEVTAWTIHFKEPLLNLFVNASNPNGTITGRAYTDQVNPNMENVFSSQVVRGNQPRQQSLVDVRSNDVLECVADYYRQSQQLPLRIFDLGNDEFALLVALPDCDQLWLAALEAEQLGDLENTEILKPLGIRAFRFDCSCNLEKIIRSLILLKKADAADLFGDDDGLIITCPQCGASYAATREMIDTIVDDTVER